MDLLDRLLGHDAWTTRQLLGLAVPLDDAALDRGFDLGHGTLRATFEHIVHNMEVWTDLMDGVPVRERPGPGEPGRSPAGLIARLDRVAEDFARVARDIARRRAWDVTWLDVLDDPPNRKTYGGAIAHVITHSMHHRAQAIHMLRRLGVDGVPEGDSLSWEKKVAG